jgi:hypothetical protein
VANKVYPKARVKFAKAQLDLRSVTLKAALIETNYAYSDAHAFLSDIPLAYRVAIGPALTGCGVGDTDASFHSDNTIIPAVAASSAGEHVKAIVLFHDTGNATTSDLIAYIDSGVTGLPFIPRGADEQIIVPAGGWFALSNVAHPANVLLEHQWANGPTFGAITIRPRISIIPQIDGHAVDSSWHTGTTTVTLTTAFAGDAIVICYVAETIGSGPPPITSISSAHTTGWTLYERFPYGSDVGMEIWYGFAAAALSAEVITVTASSGVDTAAVIAFGIHDAAGGAYSTNPFETGSAQPATGSYRNFTTFAQTAVQLTGISERQNDLLLIFYGTRAGTRGATVGTGDTMIDTKDEQGGTHSVYGAVEYRALHSALVNSTEGFSITSLDWGLIVAAVKGSRDSGGPPGSPSGDGWTAWTGTADRSAPQVNNISGVATVTLAQHFKALLDDYLAGSFSGWATWPITGEGRESVNTEGNPANITLCNTLGTLIADVALGYNSAGWHAWTGVADRSSHNTATATNTDIARAMKALIDDLLAAGVLTT